MSMQPDSFDRFRRQLQAASDQIRLAPGSEVAVLRAAHRRRSRNRMAVGVAAAVAVGGGSVVTIQQLGKTSPGRISVGGETGDTTPDNAVAEAATAAPEVVVDSTVVQGGPADVALQAAVRAESAYTWNALTPEAATSVFGVWAGQVPGIILSTAPGRSDTPVQQAYYTSDGVHFEQLDLDLQQGFSPNAFKYAAGDSIYLVGTSPAVAADDPNPITVRYSADRGATWQAVTLPVDGNHYRRMPFVGSSIDAQVVDSDIGPVAVVNTSVYLDTRDLETDLIRDVFHYEVTPEGVNLISLPCDPQRDPAVAERYGLATTIPGSGPDAVAAATGTTIPRDGCAAELHTWDSLGVSAEAVEALLTTHVSQVFRLVDDQAVAVEPPAGATWIGAHPNGVFSVNLGDNLVETADSQRYFRLTETGWGEVELPTAVAWSGGIPLSSDTRQFTMMSVAGIGGQAIASADLAGGAWTYTAIGGLFGEFDLADSYATGVTPDGWAIGAAVRTDLVAQAGGVEVAKDGVIFRRESDTSEPVILDAASREPIPGAMLDWDTGPVAVAADGTQLAALTEGEYNGLYPSDDTTEWAVLTTADGVNVAVERVADLLGVTDADIANLRVNTVGRQVLVTVMLHTESSPGVKQQRILVGTPNE